MARRPPRAQAPDPPAIAGRTITLASAASGVSSPPRDAHVLALDVDVHEGVDLAVVVEQARAQGRVLLGQVVERGAQAVAAGLDGAGAAGHGAQDGRQAEAGHRQVVARAGGRQNSS